MMSVVFRLSTYKHVVHGHNLIKMSKKKEGNVRKGITFIF